jgi:tetratricopeptide (TPR) repeat protein
MRFYLSQWRYVMTRIFALFACTIFAACALLAADTDESMLRSQDIGNPLPGKTVGVGFDGFDVTAGGKDIWYRNDSFRFIYCKLEGEFDVRVRVQNFVATHEWAKAGLMARVSLQPNSAQISVILSYASGTQVMQRSETNEEVRGRQSGKAVDGVVLRLVRKGSALTGYRSTDAEGKQFEKISDALALNDGPLYVGLCLCSHNEKELCSVEFREFNLVFDSAQPVAAGENSGARVPAGVSAALPPREDPAPEIAPVSPVSRPAQRASAGDAQTAQALAVAGAKMADMGKVEQARDMFFKSLANDPNCAEALYELGLLFEKDNNRVMAGEFLSRAQSEFNLLDASTPGIAAKVKDTERRVLALNPAAAQLRRAMEDYAGDLATITQRVNDTMTLEEAGDRVKSLQLERYVTPEKLPKTANVLAQNSSGASKRSGPALPPDVERALKNGGWQTVTGTWKKLAENVYEVTDGKLESAFSDGVMQVLVHNKPDMKGTVRVYVRADQRSSVSSSGGGFTSFSSSSTRNGYGVVVENGSASPLIPYSMLSGRFVPYEDRAQKLDSPVKNMIQVQVMGNALEYSMNGRRIHKSNYNISNEGPFSLRIEGTQIIEMPQVKGK